MAKELAKEPSGAELFNQVQAAYKKVKEKALAKEEAAAVYQAASEDHKRAVEDLEAIRGPLNEMLGNTTADPRVRQG